MKPRGSSGDATGDNSLGAGNGRLPLPSVGCHRVCWEGLGCSLPSPSFPPSPPCTLDCPMMPSAFPSLLSPSCVASSHPATSSLQRLCTLGFAHGRCDPHCFPQNPQYIIHSDVKTVEFVRTTSAPPLHFPVATPHSPIPLPLFPASSDCRSSMLPGRPWFDLRFQHSPDGLRQHHRVRCTPNTPTLEKRFPPCVCFVAVVAFGGAEEDGRGDGEAAI